MVPWEVVDFLAEQLEIEDASCVKRYSERRQTHFEHVWEIKDTFGLRDFADVQAEVEAWVDARVWSTADGPKAIFDGAVAWLRWSGCWMSPTATESPRWNCCAEARPARPAKA